MSLQFALVARLLMQHRLWWACLSAGIAITLEHPSSCNADCRHQELVSSAALRYLKLDDRYVCQCVVGYGAYSTLLKTANLQQ